MLLFSILFSVSRWVSERFYVDWYKSSTRCGIAGRFSSAGYNPLGKDFSILWLRGRSMDEFCVGGERVPFQARYWLERPWTLFRDLTEDGGTLILGKVEVRWGSHSRTITGGRFSVRIF